MAKDSWHNTAEYLHVSWQMRVHHSATLTSSFIAVRPRDNNNMYIRLSCQPRSSTRSMDITKKGFFSPSLKIVRSNRNGWAEVGGSMWQCDNHWLYTIDWTTQGLTFRCYWWCLYDISANNRFFLWMCSAPLIMPSFQSVDYKYFFFQWRIWHPRTIYPRGQWIMQAWRRLLWWSVSSRWQSHYPHWLWRQSSGCENFWKGNER